MKRVMPALIVRVGARLMRVENGCKRPRAAPLKKEPAVGDGSQSREKPQSKSLCGSAMCHNSHTEGETLGSLPRRPKCPAEEPWAEASKEGENHMKETTLSKITASVRVAKGMAERVLAASPNPQWTEYELQTIDEWIARQGVKLDRSEAIRRLVELGLTAKAKWSPVSARCFTGVAWR